jgi:predicted amidohydrolase
MMICHDVHFPETARQLALNGAGVTLPVHGFNAQLGAARACENQVYFVSSAFEPTSWKSGGSEIFDYEGNLMAPTRESGSVAIADVDLNQRVYWTDIGNMRAALPRHRPNVHEGAPLARPPERPSSE